MKARLHTRSLYVAPAVVFGLGLGLGCDAADEGTGPCGEVECAVVVDRDTLQARLDGHADPVSRVLTSLADDRAVIADDFAEVLEAVSAELQCDAGRQSAFVVQSNIALAPKSVLTHCSDEPTQASRVLTVFEPNAARDDLDADALRMTAWDEAAMRYRRYQLAPHPQGGLGVMVEPAFCDGCHGGVVGQTPWVPIMSEMTNPWAQWHAEPAFTSFAFEPQLVEELAGPTYHAITDTRLDSASNLEPIIRAALDRVVAAEIASRKQAADLDLAAGLLRPVFCDPAVAYVSEIHEGGEIRSSAVLDPGIPRALRSLDPAGWPWSWVYDETVRIDPVGDGQEPLVMVTTRAEASVQAEAALLSRNVLDAIDILRVRSLDWTRPVFSDFRCALFEDALSRTEEGAIDVGALADTTELVRALYQEAMVMHTEHGPVSLLPDSADALVSLDSAEPGAVSASLVEGSTVDLQAFGEQIDQHVSRLREAGARQWLEELRVTRGCEARSRFATAPIVPGTDACP